MHRNIQNIEVLNIHFPSDHRCVRATLNLKCIKKKRNNYSGHSKNKLKSNEEVCKYLEALNNYQDSLTYHENDTVQSYYNKIITTIDNSLKTALPSGKKYSGALSERTRKLITRRIELQNTKPKSREMKSELSALYKLISKYIRQDYVNHRKQTIIHHLSTSGSLKKTYKSLKSYKTWIECLSESDRISHNRKHILYTATKFYKTLYEVPKPQTETATHKQRETNTQEISPIEINEIIREIKSLKSDKSPGPDGITNDAIKTAHKILATPLVTLFNKILDSSITPQQWTESDIILLYKKGDPKDISNYRPISLLPSLYKLFSSILRHRMGSTLDQHQPIEQAGFRKGYSTVDHIHSLELLIEKFQEFQEPLYIAFIDYQKAFDTILHSAIWDALNSQNVEDKYIRVLKYIYENSTSRVKLESTGTPIPIKRGVRQGDPLSPTIFISVLESIIDALNWNKVGININGNYISHLRFADDLVLLSKNSKMLELMIDALQKSSRHSGLEINFSKTKVMTNSLKNEIKIENTVIEYVDSYIYLGKQLSFDIKSNDQEIERKIKGTWKKYWSLKEIFKSQMPIKIKKKVMNTCLLPSLTYACQTWKFTRNAKNKINSCQRSMERSMLKIRKIQKIRNSIIREKTGVIDALKYSMSLKWRWAGHVARMSDDRWTSRLTLWKGPRGVRKRGRPRSRWTDDIEGTAGKLWTEKAKNREYWASLEEAFTLN